MVLYRETIEQRAYKPIFDKGRQREGVGKGTRGQYALKSVEVHNQTRLTLPKPSGNLKQTRESELHTFWGEAVPSTKAYTEKALYSPVFIKLWYS